MRRTSGLAAMSLFEPGARAARSGLGWKYMATVNKFESLFAGTDIAAGKAAKSGADNGGSGSIGPVLCDGAMGTMFYGGCIFINHCYDELNVSRPELVREIHLEYLMAG